MSVSDSSIVNKCSTLEGDVDSRDSGASEVSRNCLYSAFNFAKNLKVLYFFFNKATRESEVMERK
jgi:hypothetical protein